MSNSTELPPKNHNTATTAIVNAAHAIVEGWHNLQPEAAFYIGSEWADMEKAKSPAADSPEAKSMYEASLAILATWYGIQDVDGFRRYLASRRGGAQ